jgi:predicted phosphodiesterase
MTLANGNFSVFCMSDVHLGANNSILTPTKLIKHDKRYGAGKDDAEVKFVASSVSPQQKSAVMQSIEHIIDSVDMVVINGDFKDKHIHFDTSLSARKKELHRYAYKRIELWLQEHPDTSFYFIMGNHDSYRENEYADKIYGLQERYKNLRVCEYGAVIGNALFTHGDLQQSGLDILSRDHSTHATRLETGKTAQEKTANQYKFLEHFMQHSDHAKDFVVQRHGGKTSLLAPEELKDLHCFFGHSHAPARLKNQHKNWVMNVGSFRHEPSWGGQGGWNNLDTPDKLQQPVLHFEQGKLTDMERAFPKGSSWANLAKRTREQDYIAF